MTSEQVVAQAKIQSQALVNFPIVLDICSELKIAEMPDVVAQRSRLPGGEPGIHTCSLTVRSIGREVDRVKEVIRTARDVELAVLDIALDIDTGADVVVAMADRNHIAIAVIVLF